MKPTHRGSFRIEFCLLHIPLVAIRNENIGVAQTLLRIEIIPYL